MATTNLNIRTDEVQFTTQFEKDLKLAKKQNKNLHKLFEVIDILANGGTLDAKYKVKKLSENLYWDLTKEWDGMDNFRMAMGILVGIFIGIANGLGFKSIMVGVIFAICFSILFVLIFNKVGRKDK